MRRVPRGRITHSILRNREGRSDLVAGAHAANDRRSGVDSRTRETNHIIVRWAPTANRPKIISLGIRVQNARRGCATPPFRGLALATSLQILPIDAGDSVKQSG